MTQATARIQEVFNLVDREIWLVTAAANGRAGGLVATWVSAASIDPVQPVVLIGLAPNHFTAELVNASGCFALHLLGERQVDLVWRFALASGRDTDKLAGIAHQFSGSGIPVLTDCLAWLECRVISRYDAGDRLFYWADVVEGEVREKGVALREKQLLALATREQRTALGRARVADISTLAPLRQAWLDRVSRTS